MKTLTKVAVLTIAMNVLHGVGFAPVAFAASAENLAVKELTGSLVESQALPLVDESDRHDGTPRSGYSHTTPIELSQYSDDPTIPGNGAPGRTQGSGTR